MSKKKTLKFPPKPKQEEIETCRDMQAPFEATTTDVLADVPTDKVDPILEALNNPSTHIQALLQRFVLADQTPMVANAYGIIDEFNDKFLCNFDAEKFDTNNRWYLIFNDFAQKLEEKGEIILRNKCGTWWYTKIDKDTPVTQNETLLAIVAEALAEART